MWDTLCNEPCSCEIVIWREQQGSELSKECSNHTWKGMIERGKEALPRA